MSTAAESFVQEWRAARPLRDLLLRFVPADERGLPLLLALQAELLGALHAGDVLPAAAKLDWWIDELARFASPQARHPLTMALATDARAARVPASCWPQAAADLRAALDAPASADFDAQLRAAEALYAGLARIECAFAFGPDADCARTRRVLALQQLGLALLQTPRRAQGGPLPLPLAALARHQLTRVALAEAGPLRRAALAEQCTTLAAAFEPAMRLPGPLLGLRAAEAVHDRRALRRAARAREPLSELHARRVGLVPLDAWRSWRALRAATPTQP